jgi:hypothetical protein
VGDNEGEQMTMPSESLRAVKRGRDGWRQILTSKRMSQAELKALACDMLHHYPWDCHLNEYWSKYVCEHGQDREFCRKCNLENEGSISKQHKGCTCADSVQLKDCIRILSGIATDPKTSKFRKDEIMMALKGVTLQGRESDWGEVQD